MTGEQGNTYRTARERILEALRRERKLRKKAEKEVRILRREIALLRTEKRP